MSMSEELERLAALHRQGQLSDDEYQRAKAQVLQGGAGGAGGVSTWNAPAAFNSLRRSRTDRWLGGVCAGLGRATGIEPWLCRLAFVLLALWAGSGVLLYILLWIFVPEE